MQPSRSAEGLESEYLVHGVDAVVWTEGGDFSDRAAPPVRGDDVQFWRHVFRVHRPKRKFHFKPYGSKTEVSEKAQKIGTESLKNVVACLDRDHDDLCGKQIIDANVIYTRLHSWENDVWTAATVLQVFDEINASSTIPDEVRATVKAQWDAFELQIKRHVKGDVFRSINRMARHLSASRNRIMSKNQKLPVLQLDCLRQYRNPVRKRSESVPLPNAISVEAHCVGHILADYMFHTLRILVARFVATQMSYELARAMAIQSYATSSLKKPPASTYYSDALSGIRFAREKSSSA